jgi:hypothetical protein
MRIGWKLLVVLMVVAVFAALIALMGPPAITGVTPAEGAAGIRRATEAEEGRWTGGGIIPPTTQPSTEPAGRITPEN